MTTRYSPGRPGRWFMIPLGIILCAAPGLASEKAAGSKKFAPPAKLQLLADAVVFRQGATGSDLPKTVERFDPAKALGFITSSDSFQKTPAIWSYFFCGAVVLGGNMESSQPVVAFYNPFLDGVLLTQWTRQGDKSRLVAADLRIGSEMAGQKSANPELAWWLLEMGKRPLPVVMREQYTAFVKAFTKKYPVDSHSVAKITASKDVAAVRTIIERQAGSVFLNLIALEKPSSPSYSPELKLLKKALAQDNAKSLAKLMPAKNLMTAEEIIKQPANLRQRAVPVYALITPANLIVLLAPSAAPRFCMLAEYARKPSPHLEALIPYDMDGSVIPTIRKIPNKKDQP